MSMRKAKSSRKHSPTQIIKMATLLSGLDLFATLTILHQLGCGSAQSLSSSITTISPTMTTTPSPITSLPRPLMMTSLSLILSETPSSTPDPIPTTTEDPIQRHLALIIGVPTGIGLSIIGLGLCMLWLACSSYCEYRKSLPQQPNTAGSGGTRSTNAQANTTNSYSKSGSMPMKPTAAVSTSASESQAFQPVPDPEPDSDPAQELESDPGPEVVDTEQIEHVIENEVSSNGHLEGTEAANSRSVTPPSSSS